MKIHLEQVEPIREDRVQAARDRYLRAIDINVPESVIDQLLDAIQDRPLPKIADE